MTKVMGPFRDSRVPSLLSGPRTDVPAEPPLIGPDYVIPFDESIMSMLIHAMHFNVIFPSCSDLNRLVVLTSIDSLLFSMLYLKYM